MNLKHKKLFLIFFLLQPLCLRSEYVNNYLQERIYAPIQSGLTSPLENVQTDSYLDTISLIDEAAWPNAIANDSVDIMSGKYIFSEELCSISGPDCYVLGHNYRSSLRPMGKKSLGYGWNLQHNDRLHVYQPQGINYTKGISYFPQEMKPKVTLRPYTEKNKYTRVYISEADGTNSTFKGNGWAKNFRALTKNTGFINTNGSSLKNTSVNQHSYKDGWLVTSGDNTRRYYNRVRRQRSYLNYSNFNFHNRKYRVSEETKPSGNKQLFKYNDNGRLIKVETVNSDGKNVLGWAKFNYLKSKGSNVDVQVETSDGDTYLYGRRAIRGIKESGIKVVTKIQCPGFPLQHIYYSGPSNSHERRIKKITYDNGSFVKTKYYRYGTNMMRNHLYDRTDKASLNFIEGKVRLQEAPVGPEGESIVTHTYYYHDKNNGYYHTTVVDPYGTKTRYYYASDKRLRSVEKIVNKQVVAKEEFVWGKNDTSQEGNLLGCILYDDSKVVYAKTYEYDSNGNIVKETQFGNFTGKTKGSIFLDGKMPNKNSPCDIIEKIMSYSNDTFNLKVSEIDFDGNYTLFRYKPGTNLLVAKFSCEGKKIKKREFFTYDRNAILIKETIDDGSSEDNYDLANVTRRSVRIITPKSSSPYFGVPERVEEFYEHPKTMERHLIKTSVNTFNDSGLVISESVYDSKSKLLSNTSYTYDKNKRVASTTDSMGGIEKIEYDEFGRVIKETRANSDISLNYTYDLAGRLIKEEEKYASGLTRATSHNYDNLSRKVSTKDPQGSETKIAYDSLNRVISVTSPEFDNGAGKLIRSVRKFSYENYGRIVKETDELGYVTTKKYNAEGKVLEEIHPDGRKYAYFYDFGGNLEKVIHPTGLVTTYEYDFYGNISGEYSYYDEKLIYSREYKHNAFHLLSETAPTGEVTKHEYDYAGRKSSTEFISSKGEKGKKIYYLYDDLDRLIEERDGSLTKKIKYDALDRVVSETKVDANGNILDSKELGYDLNGNLSSIITPVDGKKAETKILYHPNGIPKQKIDAAGNETTIGIDYYFKNSQNQNVVKKSTVSPNAAIVEEFFNTRGLLDYSKTISPNGNVISNKKLIYDASLNVISVIDTVISKGSSKDVTTKYKYGPGAQILSIVEAADTLDERKTYFGYNKIGELSKITYADGSVLFFEYDSKGRLKHQKDLANTIDYSYSYDASDRLISAKNKITNKSTERRYDGFGNLSEEMLESGLAISYSYNKRGLLEFITLPDQSKIAYGYESSKLKTISRISSASKELYSHKILERDQSSNILSQKLILNGGLITSNYDILGRVVNRSHEHYKEFVPKSGYDAIGNLLSISVSSPTGEKDHTFSYNYLSQLIKENGVRSHTFSYDSINNRLTKDKINYQVNDLNMVLKSSDYNYIYDQAGRRIQKTGRTHKSYLSYDIFDRLTSFDLNQSHVEYEYDALHRRISKSIYKRNGSQLTLQKKEYYFYSQDGEIGVANSKGDVVELRLLGEGIDSEIGAAVAFELYGEVYIPISDHRGNIAVVLSKDGKVVESYRYSAFGQEEIYDKNNKLLKKSGIRNSWRFSSKRVDEESGFIYYGRRYYDHELGRWLTFDPLDLKAAGPNLYAFMLNAPFQTDLYAIEDRLVNNNMFVRTYEMAGSFASRTVNPIMYHLESFDKIIAPLDTNSGK